jgi:hypothetical protein
MQTAVAASFDFEHPAITAKVELMTPERAEEILKRADPNRPISRPYVRELRRELEEGRWQVHHQGVAFAPDGGLIDGQHRLTAIVEAGIAAPIMVAHGVANEAFGTIDQHRKRTGGQILAMGGVTKDAPRIVAMSRAILQVVYSHARTSNTEAAQYALLHQTELELFLGVARRYTPAVAAAFAWCASLGWSETLDAAERLVNNGPWTEPQETDPMRALANRSREFAKLGAGQAGIKARFDIALNCLQAVHEDRPLRIARSSRPDYQAIERASIAPGEHEVELEPARRKSLQSLMAQANGQQNVERQSRIDYDSAPQHPSVPPPGSLAYDPDETDAALVTVHGAAVAVGDPELAEAVLAEVKRSRRKASE